MFLGSWEPSFDQKSRRVALPKKIRDYLATAEIILSFGFEKCLFGFDTKSWQEESQKQFALPITERRSRDLRRFIFASATAVKLDDQGRFIIPSALGKYAKIKRPIIIGAGDHFEVWDQAIWQQERARLEKEHK